MKNLYKIIILFAVIFITGILITVITVNSSLNTFETPEKTVDVQKNTSYLLKVEKKTV